MDPKNSIFVNSFDGLHDIKRGGGNKILQRIFLEFPVSLYASDPNWIRPLDQDIEVIFDPNKNFHFKKGEAIRWILFDENQNPIGRVAAFMKIQNLIKVISKWPAWDFLRLSMMKTQL